MTAPLHVGARLATLALAVIAPLLTQCGTHAPPRAAGCETADDCASPWVCVSHVCMTATDGADGGTADTNDIDTGMTNDVARVDTSTPPVRDTCVEFDRDSLNWGELLMGEESTATVSLVNCGNVDLELQDLLFEEVDAISHWSAWTDGEPTLPVDGSLDVSISYTPLDVSYPGGVLIADLDGALASLTMRATVITPGEPPCLQVPPEVQLGSLALPGALVDGFEVTNCGADTTTLEAAMEGTDPDVFSVISGERVLPSGATTTYFIEFSPDAAGAYAASLHFTASGPLSSTPPFETSVALRATAVESSAPPCIELTPARMDFGTIARGGDVLGFVDLRNCGTRTLSFDRPSTDGDTGAFISAPRPGAVDPGHSATLVFSARGDRPGRHALTYRLPVSDTTYQVIVEVSSMVE